MLREVHCPSTYRRLRHFRPFKPQEIFDLEQILQSHLAYYSKAKVAKVNISSIKALPIILQSYHKYYNLT